MTWRKREIMEMARESGGMFSELPLMDAWVFSEKSLEAFAKLVREDEREAISDEWHSCVYSDLEHGVRCLNEQAAKDWVKNYPEISKFGAWLEARGQA